MGELAVSLVPAIDDETAWEEHCVEVQNWFVILRAKIFEQLHGAIPHRLFHVKDMISKIFI